MNTADDGCLPRNKAEHNVTLVDDSNRVERPDLPASFASRDNLSKVIIQVSLLIEHIRRSCLVRRLGYPELRRATYKLTHTTK